MSVVTDQIQRLDAQLDRITLFAHGIASEDGDFVAENAGPNSATHALSSPRVDRLLSLTRALSTTSSSQSLLPAWRVRLLLSQSEIASSESDDTTARFKDQYESEIEWLLISKATVQIYGLLVNTLLDQILPLSDDIWYWDEVLSSYTYSSIYTIQTSPPRLWALSKDIWRETKIRLANLDRLPSDLVNSSGAGLVASWRRFYRIVHESIQERSITNIQRKALSPIALCRAEARRKRAELKKLREMIASGLGVLVDEGLSLPFAEEGKADPEGGHHPDWKGVVERSIALMDMVLRDILDLEAGVAEFEDRVFAGVEEDPDLSVHADDQEVVDRPAILARRLLNILDNSLPEHRAAMQRLVAENGKPSKILRYWLPFGVALVSSSTVLRVLVNRRTDIITWIADFGRTARDFWTNWVIDPLRKVIGTIRHDANSEIALMSRDSLRADRESLERMVVEFAIDKPQFVTSGSPLSDAQISEIRVKVGQGDVTPVLRSFEKDLKKPLVGAMRGDLIRSLLIQVQKTKVDLEVAISGIDALLKSQELVFGFVGLTPGILVSIGVLQYLRGVLGGRRGARSTAKAGRIVRVLRNIDRIFAEATPVQVNLLSYKDHGLLLCEVHLLRSLAYGLMPRDIEREFLEDLDDLANLKGIQIQVKALERIRWAYSRWLK